MSNNSNTLRCPHCQYDVSQTLRDAITTCPECGFSLDYETASADSAFRRALRNPVLLAIWLVTPWLFASLGFAGPKNAVAYWMYGEGPEFTQAYGLLGLISCCVGIPFALVSTLLWWINYAHTNGSRVESIPRFIASTITWIVVMIGVPLIFLHFLRALF